MRAKETQRQWVASLNVDSPWILNGTYPPAVKPSEYREKIYTVRFPLNQGYSSRMHNGSQTTSSRDVEPSPAKFRADRSVQPHSHQRELNCSWCPSAKLGDNWGLVSILTACCRCPAGCAKRCPFRRSARQPTHVLLGNGSSICTTRARREGLWAEHNVFIATWNEMDRGKNKN